MRAEYTGVNIYYAMRGPCIHVAEDARRNWRQSCRFAQGRLKK